MRRVLYAELFSSSLKVMVRICSTPVRSVGLIVRIGSLRPVERLPQSARSHGNSVSERADASGPKSRLSVVAMRRRPNPSAIATTAASTNPRDSSGN